MRGLGQGGWADAKGCSSAPRVRVLARGFSARTWHHRVPEVETALVDGDIAFASTAGDTAGPNWPTLLKGRALCQALAVEGPPRVALTFDDSPVHGLLPPGMTARTGVASLAALRRKAPATYGFINA
jgi:hypothetical protein